MPVLIVEDHKPLSDLLEVVLGRVGIPTQVIARGDLALEALRSVAIRPDAILLDLLLPELSGIELLGQLRITRPELLSRTIVLTAVASQVLDHFELADLVWAVIRKPFDLDTLVATVRDCAACSSGRTPPDPGALSRWLGCRSLACGANRGVVAARREGALHLRAHFGFRDGLLEKTFPIPLTLKTPLTIAGGKGRDVWFASLALARAEYPLILPIWEAQGTRALLALPLPGGTVPAGAIGWAFEKPQTFETGLRDALLSVASDCAAILRAENASAAESGRG